MSQEKVVIGHGKTTLNIFAENTVHGSVKGHKLCFPLPQTVRTTMKDRRTGNLKYDAKGPSLRMM